MNLTPQQYRDLYKKLSPDKKGVLASPELSNIINEIAKSRNLDKIQRDFLAGYVKDRMLNLTLDADSAKLLLDTFKTEELVKNITGDVEAKILNGIANIQKQIQENIKAENVKNGISNEEETEETQPISQVPPVINQNSAQTKTKEIASKYALGPGQSDMLVNTVIESLGSPQSVTIDTLMSKLTISRLLAEQILEELKARVFETTKKTSETKAPVVSKIPEVKPNNLPAIEIGETSHPYTPEKPPIPAPNMSKPSEPVQKPYGVPRFGMSQIPPKVAVINMNENKPSNPQNMMNDKMNNVTLSMGDKFIPKDVSAQSGNTEPPKMPGTKYAVDPYREPLA